MVEDVDLDQMLDLTTPWCLRVAATLHLPEHIAAGHTDIAELALMTGCDQDALHAVLAHLVSRGVFIEKSPGQFACNRAADQLAEPGRFISAPAAIGVASVMGRALRDGRWWYYLDDGLYGSYSGQMYDHAAYPLTALVADSATHSSVLAGPTCDSIDVIGEQLELPKLDIGDLIVGRMMGAYTWASASEFNFFPRATVLALDQGRLLCDGDRG